jgi:DNA mismatch repair ATPase MutS
MRLLSKWKDTYQKDIDQWIWALSEMETLVSLSCLAHNNPEWCYPIIDNKHLSLNTRSAGHPLLHPRTRINNDLNMSIENHIRLITGSNMAGKSTFLRAIGCNIVLANAGSVCCAESFTLPKLSLFSSMRSNDALEESTSGFYAELKKLKRIIDVVSNKEHCFFLIDEVLKGTNTKDRHLGSVALIKQLIENPSAGLVSTHDLELASLEETTKGQVENWCFEVDVDGDKLSFDYRIKRGVSQSFNATHLMRNMGIKI